MRPSSRRYSKEEIARCGDEIYARLAPKIEEGNKEKYVAIDVETGDYEIDANELQASNSLYARHEDPKVWIVRIGSRFVRHFRARSAA